MKQLLKDVVDNRTYNIIYKKEVFDFCYVCQKKKGRYYASCNSSTRRGIHGNGKGIYTKNYRDYRTWKYNRKTKWK